jgi:hypothetical protein
MEFKLNDFHRNVPEQELLDDLKRVANEIGSDSLSMDEYNSPGKYGIRTIQTRFGTWNNALKKAGLEISLNLNISDQELLEDLKSVANQIGKNKLTQKIYNETGKYGVRTIQKRFGTWNNTLKKAGLEISLNLNISDNELFENIEEVWINLGRQPIRDDMRKPLSKYSESPYNNRFGSWRKALEAFVEFINSDNNKDQEAEFDEATITPVLENEIIFKHKTKRTPSERLKVQVLMRDGNKCRLCGLTLVGLNIHFDHILAWSKGGETVLENLQILCAAHNLAKGNLKYPSE